MPVQTRAQWAAKSEEDKFKLLSDGEEALQKLADVQLQLEAALAASVEKQQKLDEMQEKLTATTKELHLAQNSAKERLDKIHDQRTEIEQAHVSLGQVKSELAGTSRIPSSADMLLPRLREFCASKGVKADDSEQLQQKLSDHFAGIDRAREETEKQITDFQRMLDEAGDDILTVRQALVDEKKISERANLTVDSLLQANASLRQTPVEDGHGGDQTAIGALGAGSAEATGSDGQGVNTGFGESLGGNAAFSSTVGFSQTQCLGGNYKPQSAAQTFPSHSADNAAMQGSHETQSTSVKHSDVAPLSQPAAVTTAASFPPLVTQQQQMSASTQQFIPMTQPGPYSLRELRKHPVFPRDFDDNRAGFKRFRKSYLLAARECRASEIDAILALELVLFGSQVDAFFCRFQVAGVQDQTLEQVLIQLEESLFPALSWQQVMSEYQNYRQGSNQSVTAYHDELLKRFMPYAQHQQFPTSVWNSELLAHMRCQDKGLRKDIQVELEKMMCVNPTIGTNLTQFLEVASNVEKMLKDQLGTGPSKTPKTPLTSREQADATVGPTAGGTPPTVFVNEQRDCLQHNQPINRCHVKSFCRLLCNHPPHVVKGVNHCQGQCRTKFLLAKGSNNVVMENKAEPSPVGTFTPSAGRVAAPQQASGVQGPPSNGTFPPLPGMSPVATIFAEGDQLKLPTVMVTLGNNQHTLTVSALVDTGAVTTIITQDLACKLFEVKACTLLDGTPPTMALHQADGSPLLLHGCLQLDLQYESIKLSKFPIQVQGIMTSPHSFQCILGQDSLHQLGFTLCTPTGLNLMDSQQQPGPFVVSTSAAMVGTISHVYSGHSQVISNTYSAKIRPPDAKLESPRRFY